MTVVLERPQTADLLTAPMPLRPLGRLPWSASVLTLGGVKWDTQCADGEAAALIRRAYELGVNTFDTAWGYGDGESERKLGLALEGIRDRVWVNTKTMDRTCDGARRQIETSLQRLRTDRIDLLFVHSLNSEEDYDRILGPDSVLKAIEEYRSAGHVRYVGVSGHWVKDLQARILQEYPFDAVLFPAGLFNIAYRYSFLETVLPVARQRGMAVLGMKIFGAGRVQHARSIEPYLRYSLNQPIDTCVIGCDSIAQLEATVRVVKACPPPLSDAEQAPLLREAIDITQEWDEGEFAWVQGYPKP
jgi:aryl-alcohol dehydrogenase-like predicted oxidoreductase